MVEESFAKRAAKQRDTAILRSLLVCGASRTDRRARVPESPRRLSVAGYFGETLLRLSAAESEPSRGGEARSRLHAFGTRLASRWTLRANHRSFLDSSVTLALVNSLAVTRHGSKEVVEPSVTSTGSRSPAYEADVASRIVGVLRRAFAPALQSTAAVMGR